jgi:HEPN domain-containing protein
MDEKEKALKRFAEWEKYALEDEQIILIALAEDGPPNQICLHSQQMAEKYLKGYLAFCKNIPLKTHQMGKLIDECKKYDAAFEELKEDAIELDDFYIETRYPGDMMEFTIQNAKDGYEFAKRIKNFVLSMVKS